MKLGQKATVRKDGENVTGTVVFIHPNKLFAVLEFSFGVTDWRERKYRETFWIKPDKSRLANKSIEKTGFHTLGKNRSYIF